MLTELTHTTVYVSDDDAALEFYTGTLGFETRDDVMTEYGRWLTVGVPDAGFPELVLMAADEESADRVGTAMLVVAVDDCHAEYERLTAAGVAFHGAPETQPWGVEAGLSDPDGNVISLLEPTEMDAAAMADLAEQAGH